MAEAVGELSVAVGEVVLKSLLEYVRSTAKRGTQQSIIYFTVFLHEPAREEDVNAFIGRLLDKHKCGRRVSHPLLQQPGARPACVESSVFIVSAEATMYQDLLSTEPYLGYVLKVMHDGEAKLEYPLLEELGLQPSDELLEDLLSLVKDFTLVLYPVELYIDDLVRLLRHLYDETKGAFSVEDRVVKIEVYGDEKRLIDIEKSLRSRYGRDIKVYLGEGRVVVIPHELLLVEEELYQTIYQRGPLVKIRRILPFKKW